MKESEEAAMYRERGCKKMIEWEYLFGAAAVITAIANAIKSARGKDGRLFMFLSLSCVAIANCFAYDGIIGLERDLVLDSGNWFVLTGIVIAINSVGLFGRK